MSARSARFCRSTAATSSRLASGSTISSRSVWWATSPLTSRLHPGAPIPARSTGSGAPNQVWFETQVARRAVVFGAGGAARAVLQALAGKKPTAEERQRIRELLDRIEEDALSGDATLTREDIEANHVYVISPDRGLVLRDGRLEAEGAPA
mgnify:CR=1 FL=1